MYEFGNGEAVATTLASALDLAGNSSTQENEEKRLEKKWTYTTTKPAERYVILSPQSLIVLTYTLHQSPLARWHLIKIHKVISYQANNGHCQRLVFTLPLRVTIDCLPVDMSLGCNINYASGGTAHRPVTAQQAFIRCARVSPSHRTNPHLHTRRRFLP